MIQFRPIYINRPAETINGITQKIQTIATETAIHSPRSIFLLGFLKLTAILPMPLLSFLGRGWGRLLYWFPGRTKETTIKNLQTCFADKSEQQLASLTLKSLQHTACLAMEMGKAWLIPLKKAFVLVRETEGLDEFHQAVKEERGIILLAPHLGNWEIFGPYICEGVPSTFMYQPPKLESMDKLLKKTRARNGIKLAPTNVRGVSQLIKALKKGEMVGLLPDQVPTEEGGAYADFFAEPAWTMTLVSKLISRTKPRVFFGYAKRLENTSGFKVVIREADSEIYSEDLQRSLNGLNKSVERCVMDCPEQYQWEYKRFRRQPGGRKFY